MSRWDEIAGELDDFQAWKSTSPRPVFTLFDYAFCVATPDNFFGFMALVHPDLVIHDGVHFLQRRFSVKTYEDWKARLREPAAIQRVMNHIHIGTLFQQQRVSDEVAVKAARALAETWSLTLATQEVKGLAIGNSFHDAAVTLVER